MMHVSRTETVPAVREGPTGRSDLPRRAVSGLLYIVLPLAVLVVWEYVGQQRLLANGLFPPFSKAVWALVDWVTGISRSNGPYSGNWHVHAWDSTRRILTGFLLGSGLAIFIGVLVGWWRPVEKAVDPSVNLIRPISVTAWIPLSIILFGIGDAPAIFLTAYATFFPVYVNTAAGVRYASGALTRAARMLGCDERQLLLHVVLPGALPSIMTGVRVSAALAWTTVVVSEMLGAKSGLGYALIDAYNFFKFDIIFASMFSIGALGFLTDRLIVLLRDRQLRWVSLGSRA